MRLQMFMGLALVAGWASADTCYENGSISCYDLAGSSTPSQCDTTECEPLVVMGSIVGYKCPSGSEDVEFNGDVGIAVWSDEGYESAVTMPGTEKDCVATRPCQSLCWTVSQNGTDYCSPSDTALWSSSDPYLDTIATGNYCYSYDGGY